MLLQHDLSQHLRDDANKDVRATTAYLVPSFLEDGNRIAALLAHNESIPSAVSRKFVCLSANHLSPGKAEMRYDEETLSR